MFKVFLVVVTALFIVQESHATGNHFPHNKPVFNNHDVTRVNVNPVNRVNVGVNPNIRVNPRINSTGGNAQQSQVQSQNQENEQGQSQSADNAGNSQNVNFRNRRNNPNMAGVFMSPTAVCAGIIHGQGVGGGIGISLGGSYQVVNCEINETAKTWLAGGNMNQFNAVLCQDAHSKNTIECLEREVNEMQRKKQLAGQLAVLNGEKKQTQRTINRSRKPAPSAPFNASNW
ncbi:MAG: hypothetical protein ACPGJH_07050 [Alphaproteobacteria bacterium]